MIGIQKPITQRERELGAIINAYNEVTERLKRSHDQLVREVSRLREQLDDKNRQLARGERLAALGEMAAGVAHEIRNPLAAIQLNASLLAKELGDRVDAREWAGRILAAVQSLDGVVSDVLAFAGHGTPRMTAVALAGAVRDCMESAEPTRAAHATTIHVDGGIDRYRLDADPRQVRQAILNLMLNAIEASGAGGSVWLSASSVGDGRLCTISVADNGPGVPVELADKIFNPFFTTRESGTGLGLAIVHRVAESHGGGVRVAERPGGGAEFSLTLPMLVRGQGATGQGDC